MTVLQTVNPSSQPSDPTTTSDNAANHLASDLASLIQESPDLAVLVAAWPTLPDHIRAAVLALVECYRGGRA